MKWVPQLINWISGHRKGWLALWSGTLLAMCVWVTVEAVEAAHKAIDAGGTAVIDLPERVVYVFLAVLFGDTAHSVAERFSPPPAPHPPTEAAP